MSGLVPVAASESQTELIIDLAALVVNWRSLAARIAPAACAAVVKADAYGVGAEQASKALFDAGCRVFFVAQPSEGAQVRAIVGAGPAIYVLNGLIEGAGRLEPYGAHDLRPVLGSQEDLRIWSASGLGMRIASALHVDTGMNRLGLPQSEAFALAGQAGALGIELVMSHFVSSEAPTDPLNAQQIARFEAVRAAFPGQQASMAAITVKASGDGGVKSTTRSRRSPRPKLTASPTSKPFAPNSSPTPARAMTCGEDELDALTGAGSADPSRHRPRSAAITT